MLLESLAVTTCGLVVYHHALYPLALKALASKKHLPPASPPCDMANAPTLTLVVPAYNEENFIAAKIRNCAELDYPADRLQIVIVCDGCTDETVERARAEILTLGGEATRFKLLEHEVNRGKVARINEAVEERKTELFALSDVSATLSKDALLLAAASFADETVGFVTGTYTAPKGDQSQQAYWRYQTEIKRSEAALGSPIGAHGAFYMFRRDLADTLEPDTINDDVILPMRIIECGFRGIYDTRIPIVEIEADRLTDDFKRRQRLGAGALQQVFRLFGLSDPRRPGMSFTFLSGKALRAFMPFIMIAALVSSLALSGSSHFFAAISIAQLAGYALAGLGSLAPGLARRLHFGALSYLVTGYTASGWGALRYMAGRYRSPWTRIERSNKIQQEEQLLTGFDAFGKRALDILVAGIVLVVFVILLGPIALAIKLESRGPVFYRQLRVGLRTPTHSRLFYLTKFRSMRTDAEAGGAVWATERDPRITRVGNFLRKSRLDELPQCIDVLRGDMSVVGPRPERPQFFERLEREIPYYSERTFGLKPGITGLAQVYLPYDTTIEDVRAKVLHDHAYALRVSAPGGWFFTDIEIMLRTFAVMILGKGR